MTEIGLLTRTKDEVIYTIGVLKKLGVKSISTLDERINCQKKAFFAKSMKIIPPYSFNLYIHGPYSPNLSHDIYANLGNFATIPKPEFATEEINKKFIKLDNWLTGKKTRELEILATYQWISNGKDITDIKKEMKKLKQTTEEEVLWCKEELSKLSE